MHAVWLCEEKCSLRKFRLIWSTGSRFHPIWLMSSEEEGKLAVAEERVSLHIWLKIIYCGRIKRRRRGGIERGGEARDFSPISAVWGHTERHQPPAYQKERLHQSLVLWDLEQGLPVSKTMKKKCLLLLSKAFHYGVPGWSWHACRKFWLQVSEKETSK